MSSEERSSTEDVQGMSQLRSLVCGEKGKPRWDETEGTVILAVGGSRGEVSRLTPLLSLWVRAAAGANP